MSINFPPLVTADQLCTTASNRCALPAAARVIAHPGLTERSVFHQPWWLDTVTGGDWHVARVMESGELVGEMPYSLVRKGLWTVSEMPPLTRCLGPVIKAKHADGDGEWRYRLSVCSKLIEQLPDCGEFFQLMDPRVSEPEAIAFSFAGFEVINSFTLKIFPEESEEEVWKRMRPNTRNLIRRAAERLEVTELLNADSFVEFYNENLAARQQSNVYDRAIMRNLLGEVLRRGAGKLLASHNNDGQLQAAIAVVWDDSAAYYFLSSRRVDSHGGAISLLVWSAMRLARERQVIFDFDGISTEGILAFLSGFGGTLVRRLQIRRSKADYATFRKMRRSSRDLFESATRAIQGRLLRRL